MQDVLYEVPLPILAFKTQRKSFLHFQFYDAAFIGFLKTGVKNFYVDIFGVKKRGGASCHPDARRDPPHASGTIGATREILPCACLPVGRSG